MPDNAVNVKCGTVCFLLDLFEVENLAKASYVTLPEKH